MIIQGTHVWFNVYEVTGGGVEYAIRSVPDKVVTGT